MRGFCTCNFKMTFEQATYQVCLPIEMIRKGRELSNTGIKHFYNFLTENFK